MPPKKPLEQRLFSKKFPAWKGRIVIVWLATAAIAACRPERAPVEELYTTRMLGPSYLQRNQLPEAEAEFKKLTKLAPDDPARLRRTWGSPTCRPAATPRRRSSCKRARELDPTSTEVGLALAKLYSLTGRPVGRARDCSSSFAANTGNAHVLYALAELDAQQPDSCVGRAGTRLA